MKLYNILSLNYYYYVVMPCANDSNKHLITHDTKTVVKHRHISLDHYNLLTLEISQMPTGGHAYVAFLVFVKQNHVAARSAGMSFDMRHTVLHDTAHPCVETLYTA
jgi:hypothetical protein